MILILFVPAIVWMFLPLSVRPWVGVGAVACLVLAVVLFIRRLQRGWAQTLNAPGRADWRWRKQWDAAAYRQHLLAYLEECGLKVLDSAPLDDGRVQAVCEWGRDRAVLLCVRPDLAATEADTARLLALQARYDAGWALLVAEKVVDEPDHDDAVLRVSYAALGKPETIGPWAAIIPVGGSDRVEVTGER